MNYLAHALLAGKDKNLVLGNFIADHLRGNNFGELSPAIIEGVKMHRRIDAFTDQHPLFKKSKRYFYGQYSKYSGILVDIYFDHLLAKNFRSFSFESLSNFAENIYEIYRQHASILPAASSRFLKYVLSNNIYEAYSKEEGIRTVLYHLSRRINHGVDLDKSFEHFELARPEMEIDFKHFFSDALAEFGPSEI